MLRRQYKVETNVPVPSRGVGKTGPPAAAYHGWLTNTENIFSATSRSKLTTNRKCGALERLQWSRAVRFDSQWALMRLPKV